MRQVKLRHINKAGKIFKFLPCGTVTSSALFGFASQSQKPIVLSHEPDSKNSSIFFVAHHFTPYFLPVNRKWCILDLWATMISRPPHMKEGIYFPIVPYHEELLKAKTYEATKQIENELIEKSWHPSRLHWCFDMEDQKVLLEGGTHAADTASAGFT